MSGYISEYQYKGLSDEEFIEIAVPTGTDVSSYTIHVYQHDGTVIDIYLLGASVGTMSGQDIYVIDSSSYSFSAMTGEGEIYADDALALVDNSGNVIQFISHEGNTVTAIEGPAAGLTSENVGTADFQESLQSDDSGTSYYVQSVTNKDTIPACYAPDTRIKTPNGSTLIQNLVPGDLIQTCDCGPQQIRWVWSGTQALDNLHRHQRPVLISKNALGPGKPDRDLIVSCQHRIVVGIPGQLHHLFLEPAMVPAKALTSLPGIRSMSGKASINWHHFLCDKHCIPMANNLASETLLLGPQILNGLKTLHRRQLSETLGQVVSRRKAQTPALQCLTKRQTLEILGTHKRRKNLRPQLAS